MATSDEIEQMLTQLQHEVVQLQHRDREHDHHITLLLGQLLTIVPELNAMRTETNERFNHLDIRMDGIVGQLALILQKLDEGK